MRPMGGPDLWRVERAAAAGCRDHRDLPHRPPNRPTTRPAARPPIPSIKASAPVMPVGLDQDGRIEAPPPADPHPAGRYADAPAPGPDAAPGHTCDVLAV
ncbi:hypothetical protein [Streptomyces celluloflavus]|uniref:hypothetical protein n=1 Tax=Streptomyces celluloflavus TaxID=58344 RepID=UPI00365B67ED